MLSVFGDGFLLSEKTLLSHGLEAVALGYRGAIQQTLRDAMCDEVERATGRRVIAAMGCAHHDPDLMAELFVFEPPTDRLEDERFAKADSGAVPGSASAALADGTRT